MPLHLRLVCESGWALKQPDSTQRAVTAASDSRVASSSESRTPWLDTPCHINSHGTGTALGDPIEMSATCAVLASNNSNNVLYISATKSFTGHGETRAGLRGLCDVCMYQQRSQVLSMCHVRNISSHISLAISDSTAYASHMHDIASLYLSSSHSSACTNASVYQGTNARLDCYVEVNSLFITPDYYTHVINTTL